MVDVFGLMQWCSLHLLFLHLSTFSAHYGSLRRFLLMNMWFLLYSIPYVHQLYGMRCRNTTFIVLFISLWLFFVKHINKSACINLNIERRLKKNDLTWFQSYLIFVNIRCVLIDCLGLSLYIIHTSDEKKQKSHLVS